MLHVRVHPFLYAGFRLCGVPGSGIQAILENGGKSTYNE
ncbi:hypothetical protein BACCAP_02071 [Pseudoflavonifractor capillosus ATCC 29799]|uniref:Uncharacterized protein n=1 Tax=Pseudoflavonifractor capillosus ATCC 29799 TaxID=411467 RepID=A6NV35_9FIRM|nr:hypothetical protein BACCAP_02071 [Pseudoflavonifractor capillosus ATCC 29799]